MALLSSLVRSSRLVSSFRSGSYEMLLVQQFHTSKYCEQKISNASEVERDRDPESKLPLSHAEKGTLIYTGKLSSMVKGLKIFSFSTSLLAIGAQPLIFSCATEDLLFKAGLLGSLSVVLFATPVMIHMIMKKYVTDVYFNEETKTFTLAYKNFFFQRREIEYKPGEASVPFVGGMFVSHIVKNKPFFMQISDFQNKEIYKLMVGYDKPLDWGIKDPNAHLQKKKRKFGLWEDEDAVKDEDISVAKSLETNTNISSEEKQQTMCGKN